MGVNTRDVTKRGSSSPTYRHNQTGKKRRDTLFTGIVDICSYLQKGTQIFKIKMSLNC